MLYSILKLFAKCILLIIFAFFISSYILIPIAQYIFPPPSRDTPLKTLVTIVNRKIELSNIEKQLQDYISPNGRLELSNFIQQIDILNSEFKEMTNEKIDSRNGHLNEIDNQHIYKKRLEIFNQNAAVDRLLEIFHLKDKVSSVTSTDAIEVLDQNFKLLRQYGFYLNSRIKSTDDLEGDDLETVNSKCTKALDALVNLMKEGEELTLEITKSAAEVEYKLNIGESLESMNLTAQVENFNTESDRLQAEVENLLNQEQIFLGRTNELIHKSIKNVKELYNQFEDQLGIESLLSQYKDFIIQITKIREENVPKIEKSDNAKTEL